MKKLLIVSLTFAFIFSLVTTLWSQTDNKKEKAIYKIRVEDNAIKKIKAFNKDKKKKLKKITESIHKKHKKLQEKKKKERKRIRFDMSNIVRPTSPKVFKSGFHFPPIPQYQTGTCWSFSTTSFLESETYRINGTKVKLSEIYTAYWEYVEKARRFIKERGHSFFAQGSEADAVIRIWKKYGIVPLKEYPGVKNELKMHDHSQMYNEMSNYLKWIESKNFWCEETALASIKIILNKYLGEPPAEFVWKGKKYTPKSFFEKVVKLDLDDYVQLQSTLSQPFYAKGIFDVPDNWWKSDNYWNVPLDDFMAATNTAVEKGYTIAIGGDVSEPGMNGWEDIAVIPSFDIPAEYIDQSSREMRIANRTTQDDHGIHIVGYTKLDGHYWYLVKDSGRTARLGKFYGYYLYRDDFVKLKMLTVMIHKDAIKEILDKIKAEAPKVKELKFLKDGK